MNLEPEDIFDLERFNFWIKSGDKEVFKFKSSNFLDVDKRYSLTKEEEKALDKYLEEKYYVPINYESGEDTSTYTRKSYE